MAKILDLKGQLIVTADKETGKIPEKFIPENKDCKPLSNLEIEKLLNNFT